MGGVTRSVMGSTPASVTSACVDGEARSTTAAPSATYVIVSFACVRIKG